jgi:hypothetical protein
MVVPGMSKWTFYGKIYRPDVRIHRLNVRARPLLSRGCVFIRGWVFNVRADGKKCICTDELTRLCGPAPSHPPAPLAPSLTRSSLLLSHPRGFECIRTDVARTR